MFVKRNSIGKIVAISIEKSVECNEPLTLDSKELQHFLQSVNTDNNDLKETLQASDEDFIRVLEDLINLLSNKGIIKFTELPIEVQKKLLKRQTIRSSVDKINLFDEDALARLDKNYTDPID